MTRIRRNRAIAAMFCLLAPAHVPAQPINTNLLTSYIGNQTPNTGPETAVGEPMPERAKFALSAPDSAEAGQKIPVKILRQRADGRPHNVRLQVQPVNLVRTPILSVAIGAEDNGWDGEIETVPDPKGPGPYSLSILLMPDDDISEIGVPRLAEVSLTLPATYLVSPPGTNTPRGSDIVFSVSRKGGTGDTKVPYNVTQGSILIANGELSFGPDGSVPSLGFQNYDPCGEPLTFALLGVRGETKALAPFSDEPPSSCFDGGGHTPPRTFIDYIKDWWPWWLIPLVLPLGWIGIRRIWSPEPGPNPADNPPVLVPELRTSFDLQPGRASFPKGQPTLRLPSINRSFRIIPGRSECPNPLPLREKMDG